MKMPMRNLFAILVCSALDLLSGCSTVSNDHFYTLSDVAQQIDASKDAKPDSCASVAISAITLPEAVERSELVLRNGAHGILVVENQRWAEPLKSAIPRVIAVDVGIKLQCNNISALADNSSHDAKYLVWVDITRFDSILGHTATLDATWVVHTTAGGAARRGTSHHSVAVRGNGFDDLGGAHADGLALLSNDIAAQVQELEKSGNGNSFHK